MTDCDYIRDKIAEYIDNEKFNEDIRFLNHIKSCYKCKQEYDELKESSNYVMI